MGKENTTLLILLVLGLIVSIGFTYHQTINQKNFKAIDTDPGIEFEIDQQ